MAFALALPVTASLAVSARQMPLDAAAKVMTEAEYVKAMKELQSLDKTLRSNIEEIARADLERTLLFDATMNARKDAARMEEILAAVVTFWEVRKIPDAAALAKDALQESENVSRALAVIDLQSPSTATLAQDRLGKICASCHAVHRERLADGTYRIRFINTP